MLKKAVLLGIIIILVFFSGYYIYTNYMLKPNLFIDCYLDGVTWTTQGYRAVYRGNVQNVGSKSANNVRVIIETSSYTAGNYHVPSATGSTYLGTVPKGGVKTFEVVIIVTDQRVLTPFTYSVEFG